MSQHVAGWPNASNMLRYAAFKCYDRLVRACKCWANSVGICCSEMLRSFDRGLTRKMLRPTMLRYDAWTSCDRLAGALHARCCFQQCCDMLRSNVTIVWPALANAWPTMLGYVVLKCCDHLTGALYAKCCAKQCCDMLRGNVVIDWPGLYK